MKNNALFALWGGAYLLCTLLGFVPQPEGFLKVLLFLLSLAFFIPGVLLLYRAYRDRDQKTRKILRRICAASLGLTFLVLVTSFLTALAPQWVGTLLHVLLVLVSTPMVASQYWVLSLFLWACLLMSTFLKPKA